MAVNEKKLTPRQLERRAAVLQSVREHLEEYGFDGVNMRSVAQDAGVSPSTLYEIYGSKESLIWSAVGDNLRDLAIEEDEYEPGLERFLHRLESIAQFFEEIPNSAEALTKLFFRGDSESPSNDVFLVNAIDARRTSLQEMLDMKQLKRTFDIEFHSRALISVTWGTGLFWLKGMIPPGGFRDEVVRTSMSIILPGTTDTARKRVQEIIEQCSLDAGG